MNPNQGTMERRRWKQLSEAERYKIEVLLLGNHTVTQIAQLLGRHKRTIQREIHRGSVIGRKQNPYASRNPDVPDYLDKLRYLADAGQRVKEEREANKGRGLKIGNDHKLARHLEKRIGEDGFSPEAAIGEIKAKHLDFKVTICAKTVYNMAARGDFLTLTYKSFPCGGRGRKKGHKRLRRIALNNLRGRSIEERPEGINRREQPGHWEMDLVVGKGKACLLALTERVSRREILEKLPDKRQASVIRCLDKLERLYGKKFRQHFKSITMDNGSEFLDSHGLEASCLRPGEKRTCCYYAHPFSAWERGSNENANRLIRRFIPKGTDISVLSRDSIKRIEHWMNNYPRRIHGYRTAHDVYSAA